MEVLYGYIYITTNKISGKIYIGQHKSKEYDEKYLGSGKYLRRAIQKYGKENFENRIIEWCKDKQELCEKEKYWIRKYGTLDNEIGYNITPGGEFGDITAGMTEEDYEKHCLKIRIAHNNPDVIEKTRRNVKKTFIRENIKLKISEKTKEAMKRPEIKIKISGKNNSMVRKGGHSEESKKKISAKTTGNNNPFYGRKHSEESKIKMSEAKKGIKLSYKHRKAISEGAKNKIPKYIFYIPKFNIYWSTKEEYEKIKNNFNVPTIGSVKATMSRKLLENENFNEKFFKSPYNLKIIRYKFNYFNEKKGVYTK